MLYITADTRIDNLEDCSSSFSSLSLSLSLFFCVATNSKFGCVWGSLHTRSDGWVSQIRHQIWGQDVVVVVVQSFCQKNVVVCYAFSSSFSSSSSSSSLARWKGEYFCWVSPIIIALIAIALPPLSSPQQSVSVRLLGFPSTLLWWVGFFFFWVVVVECGAFFECRSFCLVWKKIKREQH